MATVPGRPRRGLRGVNSRTSREPDDEWAQPLPVDSKPAARPCEMLASKWLMVVRAQLTRVSRAMGWCRLTRGASAASCAARLRRARCPLQALVRPKLLIVFALMYCASFCFFENGRGPSPFRSVPRCGRGSNDRRKRVMGTGEVRTRNGVTCKSDYERGRRVLPLACWQASTMRSMR